MSGPQVALPMYLGAPDAVQTLWTVLHQALTLEGLQRLPDAVAWPQELHAHWLSPDLLLSQTCGYPLTHALQGQVQLVGCFRYAAPGCEGIDCRSVLIARDEHAHLKLDSFRHLRVAFNSADSQSGYNALRAMVAPLAQGGAFFVQALETGSHRGSVDAVREGRADLAAIDCVTWALLQKNTPQVTQGLQVVGFSAPYPGLPLVSASGTKAPTLAALQSALRAVVHKPTARASLDTLLITGFEIPALSVYQRCLAMEQEAFALGYPVLA